MSEDIKELLETLVLIERNNLDHLIRTGQAIKWRKSIEQLQQENKELKEENKRAYAKYINCRKTESKFEYILTEFEKWLEEKIKCTEQYADNDMAKGYINAIKLCKYYLQELKEGKK